ncbi:hypothetical protein C8R45DRAFT_980232 [Mycena sanguinolenta]|nr:hypothetical protein C8R45DRAFT_980232 [Mycena sanguinolenta]
MTLLSRYSSLDCGISSPSRTQRQKSRLIYTHKTHVNMMNDGFESVIMTEIEMKVAHAKPIPTEPRLLSSNPVREEMPPALVVVAPNLHDENREKIIIRPRCKAYVEKQKQKPLSIRSLACFSAPTKSNDDDADVEMKDTATKVKVPPKLPPLAPRALLSRSNPTKFKLAGRIEKLPKTPPRMASPKTTSPRKNPMPNAPVPTYELCGCSAPSDCHICTLRTLFHKFCSIVSERKELIRMRHELETSA